MFQNSISLAFSFLFKGFIYQDSNIFRNFIYHEYDFLYIYILNTATYYLNIRKLNLKINMMILEKNL